MLPEELEMNQENLKNQIQRSMFGHFRTYITKLILQLNQLGNWQLMILIFFIKIIWF